MLLHRKKLSLFIAALIAGSFTLVGCDDGDDGAPGPQGPQGEQGPQGPQGEPGPGGNGQSGSGQPAPEGLKRLMTAPLGAEFTGMFLNTDGAFFANVQHPSSSNTTADGDGKVFDKGTVGVVLGADFRNLGEVAALDVPIETADKEVVRTAVGNYKVLTQQGDALGDGNAMGDIVAADGATLIKSSNDPDFNAAVQGGGGYYLYTNWEDRPGGMSRIFLSNTYAVTQEGMLDFSAVDGTWVNCFGTLSPWGTPLSAEELYFDDTSDWFNPDYSYFSDPQAIAEYKGYPTDGSGNWGNPYDYGYIVEVGVNGTATNPNEANVDVNKLELLGRFSHENPVVMPDRRTVFLSDDGTGTVLFKFVADAAADLSSGTLYAASVTQTAGVMDPAEAAFAVDWVEVASGNEADIEAAIASFDGTFDDANHITEQQINDYAEAKSGRDIDGDGSVASNPYGDDRVGFLESRKAASLLGASAEFRKMEGININFDLADNWWNGGSANGDQAYMYLAMSEFGATMADGEGDIQLDGANADCGVVYRMKLEENNGLVDIQTLVPAIVGGPYNGDRSVNQCNVNNISNPDNLVVMEDGRVLIGEDTGNHENNVIWLFDDPAL